MLNSLIDLVRAIAWPIVVGAIVFYFRKQVRDLIPRIKSAKAAGVEILAADVTGISNELDAQIKAMTAGNVFTAAESSGPKTVHIDPTRLSDVFFIGHDGTLCYSALITGASREVILHTMKQTELHIRTLGLGSSPWGTAMRRMITEIESVSDPQLTDDARRKFGRAVWTILRGIGSGLEHLQ